MKKPKFVRQDSNKYKFKAKWRKPRGLHSKMRLQKRGHSKVPGIGYRSPKDSRFLNKHGKVEVLVNNLKDLEMVKDEVVIIGSKVGTRSKLRLLEECKKRNLKVVNVKDNFVDKVMKKFEEKKKLKKKRHEKKVEKAKKEVKKESQDEVKKEVMESKAVDQPKPPKESMVKESKVDSVRQRVIPEGKK